MVRPVKRPKKYQKEIRQPYVEMSLIRLFSFNTFWTEFGENKMMRVPPIEIKYCESFKRGLSMHERA